MSVSNVWALRGRADISKGRYSMFDFRFIHDKKKKKTLWSLLFIAMAQGINKCAKIKFSELFIAAGRGPQNKFYIMLQLSNNKKCFLLNILTLRKVCNNGYYWFTIQPLKYNKFEMIKLTAQYFKG